MTPLQCKAMGCSHPVFDNVDFCISCQEIFETSPQPEPMTLAQKYPKYYKPVSDFQELDVYAIHHLFEIQDSSGCIQHASKKLLLSGVRNGGKSFYDDVREARDSLNRWLELNDRRDHT